MKRKITVFALSAMLFALWDSVGAQQTGKVPRVGFLETTTAASDVLIEAFRQGLRELGYVEGKNIVIEYRYAEGKLDRLPGLAADLVRLKVDLIVTTGRAPALAAKNATTTIPIVMMNFPDPVGEGLVASLARPGGNVTGFSSLSYELNTKRLEILKDAVPKLTRVGVLRIPGGASGAQELQLKELRAAALALKLGLEEIENQPDAKGLESAFQTAKQKQVGAIMPIAARRYFAEESGSSSLPANTVCRRFTSRRSLSMRAVSCPTG